MFEPHINEAELHQKIISLFEYRLFPELLAKKDMTIHTNEKFYQNLISLQTSIYHLDAHLEAHWFTDIEKLNWHWNNIINNLQLFNIDSQLSTTYLNHIKKYEKHELDLRKGKMPLRLDMEYFYFYKSCDVKLLRRLIYETYQLSPQCGMLSDWRYYDLVTEVNDDVEDLFEDLDYINGNRFLISLLIKGESETKVNFNNFLDYIMSKAQEKYHTSKRTFMSEIMELTSMRITETKVLLQTQLDKITQESLGQSKLLEHLKLNQILV